MSPDSLDFQMGISIGRLIERCERKQRFDMVVEKVIVEHARKVCLEHKFILMETHYADTRSRIWGAPSHLPKEPTPQPPGTPMLKRMMAGMGRAA
jgi:hypothetical protein